MSSTPNNRVFGLDIITHCISVFYYLLASRVPVDGSILETGRLDGVVRKGAEAKPSRVHPLRCPGLPSMVCLNG